MMIRSFKRCHGTQLNDEIIRLFFGTYAKKVTLMKIE